MRGHTSGYAVPNYVIDAPGGGGKIPLMPDYVVGKTADEILLTNYEDKIFSYPLACPAAPESETFAGMEEIR
ncbi:MAG: hypothetical protein R2860_14115 [Desulfobacterales bacterium]